MSDESTSGRETSSSRSQTLSRGIRALEVLAESSEPLTIAELASQLAVHRSVAYRILRTLEDHGLVDRDLAGRVRLGTRMAALARGVSRDLQSVALPELSALANDLGVTALVALLDRDEVVTLVSVEPHHARTSVSQRPGTRHPLERGAPGTAIRMQLGATRTSRAAESHAAESADPGEAADLAAALEVGYATSTDEVIPGLSAVAVPLRLPDDPTLATLAAVYVTASTDASAVPARLVRAAETITERLR